MARLFVVNCTGQNKGINYRLDFTIDDKGQRTSERMVPYRTINIPARRQIQFGGDMHPMQIADIVQQIEKTCGAVAAKDVRTAKRMGVVRLIWQEDRPVPEAVLRDVVEHNVGYLSELGAERRRRLAMGADAQLGELIERTPAKMEMEFEQVEEDPDLPTSDRLTEGLKVRHDDLERQPPAKKPRTRRAA